MRSSYFQSWYWRPTSDHLFTCFDFNPLTQLSEDEEVQDDGGRQEGVLTRVVQHHCVVASHAYLRRVLIHGSLAVTHVGDILDYNLLIKRVINHVQLSHVRRHWWLDNVPLEYSNVFLSQTAQHNLWEIITCVDYAFQLEHTIFADATTIDWEIFS